jgi:hypothetical protein
MDVPSVEEFMVGDQQVLDGSGALVVMKPLRRGSLRFPLQPLPFKAAIPRTIEAEGRPSVGGSCTVAPAAQR